MLINFKGKRVLSFKGVRIIPGINDVTAETVAAMVEHPIQGLKWESKDLEVIGKDELGISKLKRKKGKTLSGVGMLLQAGDKAALDAVANCVALPILERWVVKEKRTEVKKALGKKIAKIKNIKYREKDTGSKYEGSDGEGDND